MDIKAINYDVDINKVEIGTTVNNRNVVYLDNIKSIVNEKGLKFIADLATDEKNTNLVVCGAIPIPENQIVLFLHNDVTSFIKLFDINTQSVITIVEDSSFNFSAEYGIQGDYVYNSLEQCYTVVFTDTRIPRQVNIKTNYYTEYIDNKTRLFPVCKIPTMSIDKVENNGGFIQVGSYSFAIRYTYNDGYTSNWLSISDVVNIYKDPITTLRNFLCRRSF